MAITTTQIDTQIDAAWSALQVNEREYTVNGRRLVFPSLAEMQDHIDWLHTLKSKLEMTASAAANTAVCPVVEYQEPE